MTLSRTLLLLSVVMAAAYGLKCRTCILSVLDKCIFGDDITCNADQSSCIKTVARFPLTDKISLATHGCSVASACNTTSSGSFLGLIYNTTSYCCSTDTCNSASSLQLSFAVGSILALLSTLWATQ